jgi:hypothetical protein
VIKLLVVEEKDKLLEVEELAELKNEKDSKEAKRLFFVVFQKEEVVLERKKFLIK